MKVMVMKRSGRRICVSDSKAEKLVRMHVAYEDDEIVIKKPLIVAAEEKEQDPIPAPRKKRRYRRRDMIAEDICESYPQSEES